MVFYKSEEEVELIRKSSLLVGKTLAEVAKVLEPGKSTDDLDRVAEEFIRDNGAVPGFKGYNGFPKTLCTSVNNAVVHGIPNANPLKDGDIVSVDCGVLWDGYYGDSAFTFEVGTVSKAIKQLLKVTKESLLLGIEQAIEGRRVGDIGYAVQVHAETSGYGVVRELVGHGVGRSLHEAPEVPNYGKRGTGMLLKSGLVLAIEPMINMGSRRVKEAPDKWTIITQDNMPSAHFEHTIVVRKERAEVLSTFEYVEEVLKNK